MGIESAEGFEIDSSHTSLEIYQRLVLLFHEISGHALSQFRWTIWRKGNRIILFVHALPFNVQPASLFAS